MTLLKFIKSRHFVCSVFGLLFTFSGAQAFASTVDLSKTFVLIIQGSEGLWADTATLTIKNNFINLKGFNSDHLQVISPSHKSNELDLEISQNPQAFEDIKTRSRSIKYYRAAIQKISKLSLQQPSHVLIFLIGHGEAIYEQFRQGARVEMFVKVPNQAKPLEDYITSMEFYAELQKLPVTMVKAVVTEACFGGGFAIDFGTVPNLIIMTSAPKDDFAWYYDYPAAEGKLEFQFPRYTFWWLASFFGKTLTEINEVINADIDRNGSITYAELHLTASKHVNRSLRPSLDTPPQLPMLFTTGWNTADLVFGETNPYSRSVMSPGEWRDVHKKFLKAFENPNHKQFPADVNHSLSVDETDARYLATMLSGIVGYSADQLQNGSDNDVATDGFTALEYFLPKNKSKELQAFDCDEFECVDKRDLMWLVANMEHCWSDPKAACKLVERNKVELWRMRIQFEHDLAPTFLKGAHDNLTEFFTQNREAIVDQLKSEREGSEASTHILELARAYLKIFELRLMQAARLKLTFSEYRTDYYNYFLKYWEWRTKLFPKH